MDTEDACDSLSASVAGTSWVWRPVRMAAIPWGASTRGIRPPATSGRGRLLSTELTMPVTAEVSTGRSRGRAEVKAPKARAAMTESLLKNILY